MKPKPEDDGLGGPRVFALSPGNQASICSLYLQHPQNVDIGSSITLSGTPPRMAGRNCLHPAAEAPNTLGHQNADPTSLGGWVRGR